MGKGLWFGYSISTHPDYAALVDPLFAVRKEGEKTSSINQNPLCEAGRVVSEAMTV